MKFDDIDKISKWVIAIQIIVIALVLGFWGTVIYLAWHFISKFW